MIPCGDTSMDGAAGQEWSASPILTLDGRKKGWYRFNK